MAAIEIWGRHGYVGVVTLSARATIVGSDPDRTDVLVDDLTVSGVHAIIEEIAGTFIVHDLGTTNGSFVNDERLLGDRRLRHTDEIRIGQTRLLFRDAASERRRKTAPLEPPPADITRTEKKVLVELVRPMLSAAAFTEPASTRAIAERLYVGKGAVMAHLIRLYQKFGIASEPGLNRRVALANAAVNRGAVTLRDLDGDDDGDREH